MRLISLFEPRDIDVSPNAARFGVEWISDEVDRAYKDAVSGWIDGFANLPGKAFSSVESRNKPIADSFLWGDSYYIVWKRSDLTIPESLSPQFLSSHEGWHAALIVLPTTADAAAAEWLQRLFGLRVLSAKRHWGTIFPPPIGIDLDGRIRVAEAESVIISVTAADDAGSDGLAIRSSGQSIRISRATTGTEVIHIIRDRKEATSPLRLQWGLESLQPIVASALECKPECLPAVRITTAEAEQSFEFHFHQQEGRQALDRVREKRAELLAVSVPRGVLGVLDVSVDGGPWTNATELGRGEPGLHGAPAPLSAHGLKEIVEALSNKHLSIRLSFGAFGQYISRGQAAIPQLQLSRGLRRRLLWYCTACTVQDSTGSPRVTGNFSDQDLVSAFARVHPRPHLISHRNFLRKQLGLARGETDVR